MYLELSGRFTRLWHLCHFTKLILPGFYLEQLNAYSNYFFSIFKTYPHKPSDIPESSFTIEGGEGRTGNFTDNIDTMHVTLVIKAAQPAHMLEYTCEFEYYKDDPTGDRKIQFSQSK